VDRKKNERRKWLRVLCDERQTENVRDRRRVISAVIGSVFAKQAKRYLARTVHLRYTSLVSRCSTNRQIVSRPTTSPLPQVLQFFLSLFVCLLTRAVTEFLIAESTDVVHQRKTNKKTTYR